MSQIKIMVFVGSLRRDSIKRCLARAVEKLAPSEGTFVDVRIGDLPIHSQNFDADYASVCQRPTRRAWCETDLVSREEVIHV